MAKVARKLKKRVKKLQSDSRSLYRMFDQLINIMLDPVNKNPIRVVYNKKKKPIKLKEEKDNANAKPGRKKEAEATANSH